MKKLLTILGLTTLVATPAMTIVSCGDPKPSENNNSSEHWLNLDGISQNELSRKMGDIQNEILVEFSEEEIILDWTEKEFTRVYNLGEKMFNEQITMFLKQIQVGLGISSQRDQIKIMVYKFEKINNNLNLFDNENLKYMSEIIQNLNSYDATSIYWIDINNLNETQLNEKLNQLSEDFKNKFNEDQQINDWTKDGFEKANNKLGNELFNEQLTMMLNQMQVGLKIPRISYGIKTTISKIKTANNECDLLDDENNLYINNIMNFIKMETGLSEHWIEFESILQEEFIKKKNELLEDYNMKFSEDEKITNFTNKIFKEEFNKLGSERFNLQITMLLNIIQIGLNIAGQKAKISKTIIEIKTANNGSNFFDSENDKYIDNIISII